MESIRPGINLADRKALEDDVSEKIRVILSKKHGYATSIFRAGRFRKTPVVIYSSKKIPLSPTRLVNETTLAHLLSVYGPDFPAPFFDAVKHILILPQLIVNGEFFLTHIYARDQKALVFYMYPTFLNEAHAVIPHDRFPGLTLQQKGVLHAVASEIEAIHMQSDPQKTDPLHLFLYPRGSIDPSELRRMEELSDLFETLLGPS